MRFPASLFACLLLSGPLHAAVSYSQPPSAAGSFLSAKYGVDGSGFDEFVWDSFSVPATRTLREIQWRGTRSGASPGGFEISINTVALPGGTVWQVAGNANETPTSTPGAFDYRFTLPAGFVVTGGQIYWLQIFATQNEIPNWQWSAGTGGNGTHFGVVVSSLASFTFPADGNKTLTANFSGPNTGPYVINAVPNPSVYGNVGGAGTFNADEVVDLDISAADGVSFLGWMENGELVNLPTEGGGLFQIIATEDRNLVANFGYPGYTSFINGVVSPAYSGTVVLAGTAGLAGKSYNGGTLITITATPAGAYHFVHWRQGAGLGDLSGAPRVVSTNPVLKHMVCYGTTLTAVFEPNFPIVTLTASPVAGGRSTGAGSYAHGSNVTVNAIPAVGYAFESWMQGATVKNTDPSYTFSLTNHTALTATYVATDRTITATAAPAESGSITGAGVVGNGASVTLTATPSSGHAFSHWTLGGLPAGTANPVTFTADADYEFVANFIAVPEFPVLSLSPQAAGDFALSWPESATGWVLEESPDLSAGSWAPSLEPVTTSGGQKQISILSPSGRRFFRLAKP